MSRPFADESVFRAIAHPARRRILDLLRKSDGTVADLAQDYPRSNTSLSHHLRVLRTSGLVRQTYRGTHLTYSWQLHVLEPVDGWIRPYRNRA